MVSKNRCWFEEQFNHAVARGWTWLAFALAL